MKTATDVLDALREEIAILEKDAAGPCIDALVDDVDRESYRDAVRRAAQVKAARRLYHNLVARMDGETFTEPPAPPSRRKTRKRTVT
jgi:hypothetical protein